MVNDYFSQYGEWVVSLTYNKGYSVLEIRVKSDWVINEDIPLMDDYIHLNIKHEYSDSKKEEGMVNMLFYAEGLVLDELTTIINKEVIEHNIEIETRRELYIEKKSELLELFNTLTIEELRKLELIKNNNTEESIITPEEPYEITETKNKETEDVTTEEKL